MLLACENLNFVRKPVKVSSKRRKQSERCFCVARNSSGPGSVISNAKTSALNANSLAMWLHYDVKYHKLFHRRLKPTVFVKIALVAFMVLCVFLVQNGDVNPGTINNDVIGRILFAKSREQLALDEEIEMDIRRQIPGLCNAGVECFLSGDEVQDGDESYDKFGINVALSDKISYNRTPPDVRNYLCHSVHYDVPNMLSASVIIIFFEEPYSVLLRTVHSVLNTAPSMLLKEIILVDDFSSFTDLKGKLSRYVESRFPEKVKLLRLDKQ